MHHIHWFSRLPSGKPMTLCEYLQNDDEKGWKAAIYDNKISHCILNINNYLIIFT